MQITYPKLTDPVLLKQELIEAFGEGYQPGVETRSGKEIHESFGVGTVDETGRLTFKAERKETDGEFTIIHLNRTELDEKERKKLNALVEKHDPTARAKALDVKRQEERELLDRRFDPKDFSPELREVIEHMNKLATLLASKFA